MGALHFVAGILGLSLSSAALADEWWLLGESGNKPDRTITLLDKDSIRPLANSKVRVWGSLYFENQSDNIATGKYLFEFDCNEQASRVVSFIQYGRNDELVNTKVNSIYEAPLTPIAPETVGSTELKFVCQGDTTGDIKIGEIGNARLGGARMLKLFDEIDKQPAVHK